METIELLKGNKQNVKLIAKAFKRRNQFAILTNDPQFNPLGHDKHSAEVWIASIGGGFLMLSGAGSILLAFVDPEPTTKLAFMIYGGFGLLFAGGGLLYTIVLSRRNYSSSVSIDPITKKFIWIMTPN
jgi:hypothetical protein